MKAGELLNEKDPNLNDGRVRLSRAQVVLLMEEYAQSKPPEEPSEHQHKEPVFGPSEHNPPYPKPMFSKSKEPSGEGSNLMIGEMAADYVDEIVGTSSYDYAPGWHFGKGLRKGLSTPPPAPTEEEIKDAVVYVEQNPEATARLTAKAIVALNK